MKLPVMVLHMSIPHIFRRKDWFRNFIRTDAVWREKREGLSGDVLMHLENMTKGSSIPWRILGLHTAGLWSLQKISAFRRILWGGLRPVITMMHSGELQKSFCTNRIMGVVAVFLFAAICTILSLLWFYLFCILDEDPHICFSNEFMIRKFSSISQRWLLILMISETSPSRFVITA